MDCRESYVYSVDSFEHEFEGHAMIGADLEERKWFYPAVIGVGRGHAAVVYSYDKLVERFMERDKLTWEEAAEWVDFNVIGSLPCYPDIIIANQRKIYKNNKNYIPAMIVFGYGGNHE